MCRVDGCYSTCRGAPSSYTPPRVPSLMAKETAWVESSKGVKKVYGPFFSPWSMVSSISIRLTRKCFPSFPFLFFFFFFFPRCYVFRLYFLHFSPYRGFSSFFFLPFVSTDLHASPQPFSHRYHDPITWHVTPLALILTHDSTVEHTTHTRYSYNRCQPQWRPMTDRQIGGFVDDEKRVVRSGILKDRG